MFNPGRVWTVVLLSFCFTDRTWGSFPAHTTVNCTNPTFFIYGSTDEGYSGILEKVETPIGVSLTLESPSCPVCLSFLDLSHSPGDEFATVNTKKALDAEALTEYNGDFTYSVACMDSGVRNSRTVKLNDLNDNAPEFEKDVYRVKVSEFLPVESLVVQVKAMDADVSSDFNTVTYKINPLSDTFEVTSDGSVMLRKQMNYAMTSSYSFTVTAMDTGSLSGATTVVVNVDGQIDTGDIVKISINKPSNVVMNQVHETERALERGLELLVKIRDVGRGRDSNALVSFIARQTSGTMVPPEDVKSTLKNNEEKVQAELQEVLGADTQFEISEEGKQPGPDNTLLIVLGTIMAIMVVAAFVLGGIWAGGHGPSAEEQTGTEMTTRSGNDAYIKREGGNCHSEEEESETKMTRGSDASMLGGNGSPKDELTLKKEAMC